MYRRSLQIIEISIMAACLTACSQDDVVTDYVETKDVAAGRIAFNLKGVSEVTSRGATVTVSDIQTTGAFGAYAYKDKDGNADFSNDYFTNQSVTYSDGIWSAAYEWPSEKLHFYCYYPIATDKQGDNGVSITANTTDGPQIAYSAPATIAKQPDLLAYKTGAIQYVESSPEVPVKFSHILSGVRFAIGGKCKPGIIIKSITLSGVQDSATYIMNTASWTSPTTITTKDYTLTLVSPREVEAADTASRTLISTENIFLVPQTVGSANSITVRYHNTDDTDCEVSAPLSEQSLLAGNRYTIQLSITAEAFTIGGTEQYDHLTIYSDFTAMGDEKYDLARIYDTFEGKENEKYDKGPGDGTSTGDEQYGDGTDDHSGTGNEQYGDGTEDGEGESTEGYGYEDLK